MVGRRGDMAPEQMAEGAEGGSPLPSPRPLDAIDQDILHMLQADGRASIRSVAERVHVSRANAYARINRLLEDGVIRGFGSPSWWTRVRWAAARTAWSRSPVVAQAGGVLPGPVGPSRRMTAW